MASPSPMPTDGNIEKKALVNEEQKKGGNIRLSKLEELGLCPHKAFPSTPVDRKKFESHNQYLELLTQLKSYGKPWFIPPPTIAKRKLKLKPMQITNVHPLKKKKIKTDREEPSEDLSKYLVLQNTCENMKKRRKGKKKNRHLSKNGVGYSLKVTDDLAFLLRTMADAREHLVQKAIENKWREEEEEKKAKEKGDIQALRNIVERMMIKFIKIEEERQAQKEKQCSDTEKRHRKPRKSSDDSSNASISDNQEPSKNDHNQEQLTKELVTFLKSLLEADNKRKEATYEEKDTSITDLDNFVQSKEGETEKMEEAIQEEEEQKVGEEKGEGDGEEKEEGETGEKVDDGNEKTEEDGKEKEHDGSLGNEANVDLNEVNKKLEDLVSSAEGMENEEKQVEEEEEEESEISEWVKKLISPHPSPRMKVDFSSQFDYFLERKLALGIEREPKDVTEDLTVFLKTMMMADSTMREIIKEKELKDYWKKMENFDSWAGGTQGKDLKCNKKCCKEVEKKNNNKQDKNKATFKCAKKTRKTKSKNKKCEHNHHDNNNIELDNGYSLQPKEFLMLLQGVHNTLIIAEEIDEERKHQEETHSEVSSEFEHSTMEPSLLIQLTDYTNEVRSVIESEGAREEETNN